MPDFLLSPIILGAVGLIVTLVLVAVLLASRYRVAGPNEAFIVTGSKRGKPVRNPETGEISTDLSGQKVVMGGGVFIWPFVQRLSVVDLSSRRIGVQIRGAVSQQGVRLNLDGVAIVKVGGSEDSIRAAAQRFQNQQSEIDSFTQEVLAGALRSIVGRLSVEQIIRDRAAFSSQVAEEAESSLTGQGLVLDAFQIQDISDDGSYLADLGRPEQAKVSQLASIAEAEALRSSEQARIAAEQEVADAQRALTLRQSQIKVETDAAQEQAAAAGPLAKAAQDENVLAAQEQVAVRQASLKERQLDTEVRKPADAERYRVETEAAGSRAAAIAEADARKAATIAAAEADAESQRLAAEAQAKAAELTGAGEKARRTAEADALAAEGQAKATAILAEGSAQAEAMEKRAEAMSKYNQAGVLEMFLKALPEVAARFGEPMSNIDNLTIVSTDGASALPKQVARNTVEIMEMMKTTTGFDLPAMLAQFGQGQGGGATVPSHGPVAAAPRTVAQSPSESE